MTDPVARLNGALEGRYQIERELGAGGMATVYLASDLKHDRKVAIKVLKPELAAVLGAERFVQEIKTTAALSHPHILPLFDSGEAGGFLYYVMPYLQGETIREKLNRETQFGIEEAVKITTEVAEALDYAHQNGVIHRDIKPENILLHNGRPMVMDFGIALAVSAAAGGRMTETGLSLGTPHYMSPEQATAEKDITARSDVYSLASVLYEMLAGQPPHLGGPAQQVIMRIITETARPVSEFRRSVPANVVAALARALEKLPADRFDSASAFGAALADPHFATRGGGSAAAVATVGRAPSWLVAVLAGALVLAVATAVWGWMDRPTVSLHVYGLALDEQGRDDQQPAFSPDGSLLIYIGPAAGARESQLWIKRRDNLGAAPIAGTEGVGTFAPSPDGRSVAFTVGASLRTIALTGAGANTILADGVQTFGIAWLGDNTIAFSMQVDDHPALMRVPAQGGTPTHVTAFDRDAAAFPKALPDGRGMTFSRCTPMRQCDTWVWDARRDSVWLLQRGSGQAQYLAPGYLVSSIRGVLMAVAFDLDRLEITGDPDSLFSGLRTSAFRISGPGTLVMRAADADVSGGAEERRLVWVDRAGRQTLVDSAWTFRLTRYLWQSGLAISPDGRRVAIGLNTERGDDIWIKELPSGPATRVTSDTAPEYRPKWFRDGRSIAFVSLGPRPGIYAARADGSGEPERLVPSAPGSFALTASDASVVTVGGSVNSADQNMLGSARIGSDSGMRYLLPEVDVRVAAPSPDGRWLAYVSRENGERQIFIRPYPALEEGRRQVSSDGGNDPVWSRDGRELYYVNANEDMMVVRVSDGVPAQPVALFRVPPGALPDYTDPRPWDVAPDGRFLMTAPVAVASRPLLAVAENLGESLKRRPRQ